MAPWTRIALLLVPWLAAGCVETRPVVLPTDQTAQPIQVAEATGCDRADTCTLVLARPLDGENQVRVRVLGIDAPSRQSQCERERILAEEARRYSEKLLSGGQTILLTDVSRDESGRVFGRLVVDGEDLGSLLLDRHLAVLHTRGVRADWCTPELPPSASQAAPSRP